jgi:hypothetical protein
MSQGSRSDSNIVKNINRSAADHSRRPVRTGLGVCARHVTYTRAQTEEQPRWKNSSHIALRYVHA